MREPSIWVLADDRAGNVSQAIGVADALGWRYDVKKVRYTFWGRMPNFLRPGLAGVAPSSRGILRAPWPDVVISAGRRTAPVARWIKRHSGGKTFLAHIMWPGDLGAAAFDLIAVPTHDHLPGARPNVTRVTGAPHRVTEARLALEGARWDSRLGPLRRPLIALVVGGSTKRRTFTPAMARELGERAAEMAAETGGSLVVTTSRRTGKAAEEALFAALPDVAHAFRWGDEGDNPFFGYLAHADAIIVTGDSVSMASEACASGAPVFIYAPPELITDKHARLHRHLFALGMAAPLEDGHFRQWEHPRLNAAGDIARAIRAALAEKRE